MIASKCWKQVKKIQHTENGNPWKGNQRKWSVQLLKTIIQRNVLDIKKKKKKSGNVCQREHWILEHFDSKWPTPKHTV